MLSKFTRNGRTSTPKVSQFDRVLPPDDESISKYICPKYVKKINTDPRWAKTTMKPFLNTQEEERKTKLSNDLRPTEESSTKKIVKFDEK